MSYRGERLGNALNLFGSHFQLDGVAIDDLRLGEQFTITDRDVTLSGLLADGSPFSFELNSEQTPGSDYFHPNATVTITLVAVPEPNSVLLLSLGGPAMLWRRKAAQKTP